MATYTTSTDVRSYYMGIVIDSDYVTDTEITRFIAESSTKIDLMLKKKYVLPFTDADDLNYLKLVCEKMVVCKIDKIFRANNDGEENKAFDRKRGYCKESQEMMEALLDGKIDLSAPKKSFRPIKYNKTEVVDDECFCS